MADPVPPKPREEKPTATSGEEFFFRLKAEAFEESNTQGARVFDMEMMIIEMHGQLQAACRRRAVQPDMIDELQKDLDRIEEQLPGLFSATEGEGAPGFERDALQGVEPKELWSESYRNQKARMAPVYAKLLSWMYASGVAPHARPASWRIVGARVREYGIQGPDVTIEEVNGSGAKAHGDDAASAVPNAKLRPRVGVLVRNGQDPVRTGTAPARRRADFDLQYHGG